VRTLWSWTKANSPRDKPVWRRLPRAAVSYLQKMGLANEVPSSQHNRDGVQARAKWEMSFPSAPAGPPKATPCEPPNELDTLLLNTTRRLARASGRAEVNGRSWRTIASWCDLKSGEKVYGDAVIADERRRLPHQAAHEDSIESNGLLGDLRSDRRCTPTALTTSSNLFEARAIQGDQLRDSRMGFPMGSGRVQHRPGLRQSYKNWQSINATKFLGESCETLASEWELTADR